MKNKSEIKIDPTVKFESFEEIDERIQERKTEIKAFNNGLNGKTYQPKDSELILTLEPNL